MTAPKKPTQHMNCRHWDKTLSDDIWLAGWLELLRRCDAVVLVPGWESSKGTAAEVRLAGEAGLPIFFGGSDEPGFAEGYLARSWADFAAWAQQEIDVREVM